MLIGIQTISSASALLVDSDSYINGKTGCNIDIDGIILPKMGSVQR